MAEQDLEHAYFWYIQAAGKRFAREWRQAVYELIATLDTFPQRFSRAFEADKSPLELRQLTYSSHRIIFTIEADGTVLILHIRQNSQAPVIE